jgi:hypothetical protein
LANDAEDRLIAPAMVIPAYNDEAAIDQSENMLDGVRAELRDGVRLVMRHPSKSRCRDKKARRLW